MAMITIPNEEINKNLKTIISIQTAIEESPWNNKILLLEFLGPRILSPLSHTTVVINNRIYGEIMYRQIAGALARRIINYAKEGMRAVQGKDAGFIKFGSRVDIYLPLGTEVNVKLGEKAIGAKTVICKKINE